MPKPKSPLKALGQRVRERRRQLKLTQEALAHEVGITPPYLSDIERGQRDIGVTMFVKLSEALQLSTDDLLFGRPESRPMDELAGLADEVRAWPQAKQEALRRIVDALAKL